MQYRKVKKMRHVADSAAEPSGSINLGEQVQKKTATVHEEPLFRKRGHFSLSGRKKEDRVISGMTVLEKNGRKVELFLVIDGHGGSEVATFLEERLPQDLRRLLASNVDVLDLDFSNLDLWSKLVTQTFLKCNEVWDKSASTFSQQKAGAVVTLVLLCEKTCLIAHVGDAKVVIQSGNQFQDLTPFHRCDNPDERERIEKCGGIVFNNRVRGVLAPSRAFGDLLVRTDRKGVRNDDIIKPIPFIRRLELKSVDCIVMATDGLFDVIPADIVAKATAQFLHQVPDADQAARFLAENAALRTDDDITVIVIGDVKQEPPTCASDSENEPKDEPPV